MKRIEPIKHVFSDEESNILSQTTNDYDYDKTATKFQIENLENKVNELIEVINKMTKGGETIQNSVNKGQETQSPSRFYLFTVKKKGQDTYNNYLVKHEDVGNSITELTETFRKSFKDRFGYEFEDSFTFIDGTLIIL